MCDLAIILEVPSHDKAPAVRCPEVTTLAWALPRRIITAMSSLARFNVSEIAAALNEPFSVANVAYVDDVLIGVYVCEGRLHPHKHLDMDELFWVHEGTMHLETEIGDARLEPGDLALVPKGTEHRTRSPDRATVILLRCGFLPGRKNGKRRLYSVNTTSLTPLNVIARATQLVAPFRFHSVVQVEDSVIQVAWGDGRWPVELPVAYDRMFHVLDGNLTVRTVRTRLRLEPGDFTVVPRGAFYNLYTPANALLVRLTRGAL